MSVRRALAVPAAFGLLIALDLFLGYYFATHEAVKFRLPGWGSTLLVALGVVLVALVVYLVARGSHVGHRVVLVIAAATAALIAIPVGHVITSGWSVMWYWATAALGNIFLVWIATIAVLLAASSTEGERNDPPVNRPGPWRPSRPPAPIDPIDPTPDA